MANNLHDSAKARWSKQTDFPWSKEDFDPTSQSAGSSPVFHSLDRLSVLFFQICFSKSNREKYIWAESGSVSSAFNLNCWCYAERGEFIHQQPPSPSPFNAFIFVSVTAFSLYGINKSTRFYGPVYSKLLNWPINEFCASDLRSAVAFECRRPTWLRV